MQEIAEIQGHTKFVGPKERSQFRDGKREKVDQSLRSEYGAFLHLRTD